MRVWLLLLTLAGCTSPVSPAPEPGPEPTQETAEAPDLADLPRRIHTETNAARRRSGPGPLQWSDALATVARSHSADMARRGYFAHDTPEGRTPQDRARAAGIDCRIQVDARTERVGVSENLYQTTRYARIQTRGAGRTAVRTVDWFSDEDLAARTVQGWLDSPGHRRNLLDPLSTQHGIGVAPDADDRVYVTQVLC